MKYTKPPLTYEKQADLLLDRGLIAERNKLIARLKEVNYYRITGYLYPFRQADDTFAAGTSFDTVWELYTFDRQLRLLVMDAIERIEVSVRSKLVYHFVHQYGPFGYCDKANLSGLSEEKYAHWISDLHGETQRSREKFIEHFNEAYADCHDMPPLWMTAEVMSFGKVLSFYKGVEPLIRQRAAEDYGVSDMLLESWLMTLNIVRNICAHHGRLWNKELRIKPKFPSRNKHPQWYTEPRLSNNRMCAVFMVLRFMVRRIALQSEWHLRVESLLEKHPNVRRAPMGLFEGWTEHPVWK